MASWSGPIPKGASVQGVKGNPGLSHLELRFVDLWTECGGPAMQREYRFHPVRMWRFDFALPELKLAYEVEGGQWSKGRHQQPRGFERDAIKYVTAQLAGWKVYRLTGPMLCREWIEKMVNEAYNKRAGNGAETPSGPEHNRPSKEADHV